jgi:membrane dipeptidase
MDVVVCCVSSDAAYQGGYVKKDGTEVERLSPGDYYELRAGEAREFTLERLAIIHKTTEDEDVVLALSPASVLEAKRKGQLSLVAALEGADGLEGSLETLRELHSQGLRLLQFVHFRANELGHTQTRPYVPGGLTDFGREVVRECNRLGIIIDLAHAHEQTTMDVLALSTRPVIFSHTGAKTLRSSDRHLSDEEIRAIAVKGGVIGIWPPSGFKTIEEVVRHIDYVKNLVGIDHVGIGTDLRGMRPVPEFGEDANFSVFAEALLAHGYTAEEVGKVMGGNFFRLWTEVAEGIE